MPTPASAPTRKYLAKRGVATRYGVVPRTIDRWVERKVLPPADRKINSRDYWDEDGLDEHDRQQTVAAGAKGQQAKPAPIPNHKEPQSAP